MAKQKRKLFEDDDFPEMVESDRQSRKRRDERRRERQRKERDFGDW